MPPLPLRCIICKSKKDPTGAMISTTISVHLKARSPQEACMPIYKLCGNCVKRVYTPGSSQLMDEILEETENTDG